MKIINLMKHLSFILFAIALFCFFSCNNNVENKKHTENVVEQTIEIEIDNGESLLIQTKDTNLSLFVKNQITGYKVLNNDKNDKLYTLEHSDFIFSEYALLKKETTINYGEISGIYPKLNLYLYSYKDSILCLNAFSIWLRSIGNDSEIKIMKNKEHVKTPPIYAIKTDMEIFVLYYLCEHNENNWIEIKEKMQNYYKDKNHIIMDIDCGGPLIWELCAIKMD